MNKISMTHPISSRTVATISTSVRFSTFIPSGGATLTLCGCKLLHLDSLLASRAMLPPEGSSSGLELIVSFWVDTLDMCILWMFANTADHLVAFVTYSALSVTWKVLNGYK